MTSILLLLLLLLLLTQSSAQPARPDPPSAADGPVSFRPSIAVVIGIFSIMFSLTLLLLMYAKFCHSATHELFRRPPVSRTPAFFDPGFSTGLDESVITALPFFRFSSLKGSRAGLECAVCIAQFEDPDLLRLLPKCNHAFHLPCVDRWLLSRSTCPLCRCPVDPQDAALFNFSSRRIVTSSAAAPLDGAHLFVERGDDDAKDSTAAKSMHKFKHRIVVSDAVYRSRWSDLNSADFAALEPDLLRDRVASERFSEDAVAKLREEMERRRVLERKEDQKEDGGGDTIDSRWLMSSSSPAGKQRCMSEITKVSRFDDEAAKGGGGSAEEEKVRRVWLPIARRTVHWFAGNGRERRPEVVLVSSNSTNYDGATDIV